MPLRNDKKRKVTDWENIFGNHTPSERFISSLFKLNKNNINNPIKNGKRIEHFIKDI